MAAAPNYELLGEGGFGIAFKPALPNTIEGVPTNFPGNITKVFFQFDDMDSTINQINALPNGVGFNKYIQPYRRTLKRRNFPKFVRNALVEHGYNMNNNVPAVHVHDLGVDFKRVASPEFQTPVRALPLRTILSEMKKLMKQVSRLQDIEFIHGDIRAPNVLIQPSTGVMNIIDFDWLKPRETFYAEYSHHFGFYSNPPESIFILASPHTKPQFQSFTAFYPYSSSVRQKLQNYASEFVTNQKWPNQLLPAPAAGSLSSKLVDDIDNFLDAVSVIATSDDELDEEKYYSTYKELLLDSFDSFGLAGALLDFVVNVYSVNEFEPLTSSCEDYVSNGGVLTMEDCALLKEVCGVLLRMADMSAVTRLGIKDALEEMNELLGVETTPPHPRRRKTRRRKHRGTRRRHHRKGKGKGKK